MKTSKNSLLSLPAIVLALTTLLFVSTTRAQDQSADFFRDADLFFKEFVENGSVKYKEVKDNRPVLDELKHRVEQISTDGMSATEKKAFLINAYNLLTISQVVEHYPIGSVRNIPGFFKETKFVVSGKKQTLNDLEKEWIFVEFPDPRLHFALVCAAVGCPPIADYAFTPDKLDEQLDQQTKRSMNDPNFTRVLEDRLQLSMIFSWYKSDFGGSNEGLIKYVNKYKDKPVPADFTVSHYPYDWSLNDQKLQKLGSPSGLTNVQAFTPSALLRFKQLEVKWFNNLYTQDHWFDPESERSPLNSQQSFFASQISVLAGVTKNSSLNAGFDVMIRRTFLDGDADGNPFKTLTGFGDSDSSRTGLTAIGPKIKFRPIKSIKRLSVQSTFWFPLVEGSEDNPFLDWERYVWWNQFFYDRSFAQNKFQAFFEADLLFRFAKDNTKSHQLFTPISAIGSYFPTNKSTVYLLMQYAPTFEETPGNQDALDRGDATAAVFDHGLNGWNHPGYFMQGGIGAKYQVLPWLEVETLYTNFFAGRAQGAGETFNIGLRYLH